MTKRTIAINTEYRLAFPDLDNIVIERLVTVDPTKSPTYDPEKHSADIRQEWRSIGKYFATIPKALTGVLEYSIRNGESTSLAEVLAEVQAFRQHVSDLFDVEV